MILLCPAFARERGVVLCEIRVHGGRQVCRKTDPKNGRQSALKTQS